MDSVGDIWRAESALLDNGLANGEGHQGQHDSFGFELAAFFQAKQHGLRSRDVDLETGRWRICIRSLAKRKGRGKYLLCGKWNL